MSLSPRFTRPTDERGAIYVLLAVSLPLILVLGALVVDVGNWYVHKRHLQTQVDAGALAAAARFGGCYFAPATANTNIVAEAALYSGDQNRLAGAYNAQVQQPDDVNTRINSTSYWPNGADFDDTVDPDGAGPLPPSGQPCATKFIDVKGTDTDAPLLFGFVPFVPDVYAIARAEILKVTALGGMLPWAVPDLDPKNVVVIFVDEDSPLGEDQVPVHVTAPLVQPSPSIDSRNGVQASLWQGLATLDTTGHPNVGIIVLLTSLTSPNLTPGRTVSQLCSQTLTQCIPGTTLGLSHIRSFDPAATALATPVIKDVQLTPEAGCVGNGYFIRIGTCSLVVDAHVEFPVGAVNPEVKVKADGCPNNGCPMTNVSGTLWRTTGVQKPSIDTVGRNPLTLSVSGLPTEPLVAVAYLAEESVGDSVVSSVAIAPSDYSVPFGAQAYNVEVGIVPSLRLASSTTEPPILLRLASTSGSQNQALDCDANIRFEDEIINGCITTYQIFGPPPDPPTCGTLANPYPSTPYPHCVPLETGDKTGQVRQGVNTRLAPSNVCAPENWPNVLTSPENYASDKRLVTLITTDYSSFTGQGSGLIPVTAFAGFYVTGWDGAPNSCNGINEAPPAGYVARAQRANVWGHFIKFVPPPSGAIPDPTESCVFTEVNICVAGLTR